MFETKSADGPRAAIVTAIVLLSLFINAFGLAAAASSPTGTTNPVGMNLAGVSYSTTEFPFLNIVKQSGSNSYTVGWFTSTSVGGSDTGEETSLNLDSDGYPLVIPQSGLTSTLVYSIVFRSSSGSLAPGQSSYYPAGSYTVQFSGAGTVTISGDASATISASGGTFTVATPTTTGLNIGITASTSGNHLHNLSIVQTSLVSSYNAGAIFHPTFLAAVANFQSFRFMDWRNTNNQTTYIGYSGSAPVAGATSLTLQSAWSFPSGTYNLYFGAVSNSTPQSEVRAAVFTHGSTAVTWSTGLTYSYTGSNGFGADVSYSWANRALPSNAFYTLQDGVPVEVEVALCNAVGANCHLNIPLTASDSYIESWGALVLDGTGAQSGYSGLNSGLKFYAELSNEVWNSAFGQYGVAGTLGFIQWPSQTSGGAYGYNRNWYGMRVAQMASDLQTQLGSAFSSCIPVLGAQAAGTYSATSALATTYWSSGPASSYPIKAIAIAPYWGGNASSGDATTMTGVTTPLDDFFATLTSQTGTSGNGSHTYSSVPSGGWLGQAQGWISAYVAIMPSYPTMKLIAYEGGQSFNATSSGTASGWPALVTSAERDARMGSAYTTYLNYWAATVGATSANINNLYNDVGQISKYGAWGALEDVTQTFSPLNSAPAKFQAIQNFISATSCSGSACAAPSISIPMAPTNLVVQ